MCSREAVARLFNSALEFDREDPLRAATIVHSLFSFYLPFISCIHTRHHFSLYLIRFSYLREMLLSHSSFLCFLHPPLWFFHVTSSLFRASASATSCSRLHSAYLGFLFLSLQKYFILYSCLSSSSSLGCCLLSVYLPLCLHVVLCFSLVISSSFFSFLHILFTCDLSFLTTYLSSSSCAFVVLLVTEAVAWVDPSSSVQTLTQLRSNVTPSHCSPLSLGGW